MNNHIWKLVPARINPIAGENGVVHPVRLRLRTLPRKEDNDHDGTRHTKWTFVGNCAAADITYYNMAFRMFGDILKVLLDYGDGIKLDAPLTPPDSSESETGFLLTSAVDSIKASWDPEGFFAKVLLEEATEKNWSGRKKGSDERCIGEGCGGALVLAFGRGR